MRTPTDIKNELVSMLNGSLNWKKLQNSLIGKELIYFGVNVVQQADLAREALVNAFDYQTADEKSLISLSHSLDVPVSFIRPSYVRVRPNEDRVYKPFELVYSVGGINFYNIDYVKGTQDVILYQGILRNINQATTNISGFQVSNSESWKSINIYNGTDMPISGFDIGVCLPESVFVFVKDNLGIRPLSEFNVLRSGENSEMYKIYTLMDGRQCVLLGDGKWGKSEYNSAEFQIVWLEPTAFEFEVTGNLSPSTNQSYEILASDTGSNYDLQYARDVFSKWHLRNVALASKSRIREYVNSFVYILDSEVSALNNNITVYVKPKDAEDSGKYDDIAADLDLFGTLFTNNKVVSGTPVYFSFLLSGDSNLESKVEDYIREAFAYDKLPYLYRVDLSSLSARLQAEFASNFLVKFNVVCTPTSGQYLKFLPIEGTIKILDDTGAVIGYDTKGVLKGISAGALDVNIDGSEFELVNDILCTDSVAVQLNKDSHLYIDSVSSTPTKSGDFVFMTKDEEYTDGTFKTLTIYRASQFTIQSWSKDAVPVARVRLEGTLLNYYKMEGIPFYYNNLLYFVKSSNEKYIELYLTAIYSTQNGNLLQTIYPIIIPYTGVVKNVIRLQNTLLLFLETSCVEVTNFDKPDYTIQVLQVPELSEYSLISNADSNYLLKLAESNVEIYRVLNFDIHDGKLMFDKQLLTKVGSPFVSVIKIAAGNNKFVVYGEKKDGTMGHCYIEPGICESINPVQASLMGQVGSIDYASGFVSFNLNAAATFDYQSMTITELASSEYLKLNENKPVVWE